MKRIFIFPTIEEAKAFILTEPRDPVFVGGVGMAEIAAATLRAVKAKKPQLVVLAGITGACDRTLRRGEVVEVVTERIAGIPERYAREYETSGPDLGLPLAAGVTVSRSGDGAAAKDGPKSAAEGTGHAAGDAGFAEPHPGFTADDRAGHAAEGTHHQTPEGNTGRVPAGSGEHGRRSLFRRMRRAGRRVLPDTCRVELRRRTLRPVGRGGGRREPDGKVKPNIRKQ